MIEGNELYVILGLVVAITACAGLWCGEASEASFRYNKGILRAAVQIAVLNVLKWALIGVWVIICGLNAYDMLWAITSVEYEEYSWRLAEKEMICIMATLLAYAAYDVCFRYAARRAQRRPPPILQMPTR